MWRRAPQAVPVPRLSCAGAVRRGLVLVPVPRALLQAGRARCTSNSDKLPAAGANQGRIGPEWSGEQAARGSSASELIEPRTCRYSSLI